ncbi:MAG: hypothetical protein ACRDM0_13690 [Thermoleophilaceae bacterium]
MSRLLLVIAMVVSLWPIGLIAASAATDSSTTDEPASQSTDASSGPATSTSGDTDDTPTDNGTGSADASPPEPDDTAYKSLRRRTDRLLKQLDASDALHGVADPQLGRRARQLAADYAEWDAANGPLDSDLHRLAVAERRIAQRLGVFAAAPTQDRLDRVNAAIKQFNRTLRAVQE